ncbi:hypothetical protein [Desulfatibacillum aliphaticivorans]|nr:hypothetical protein [Desulfatibacillum aliphaticivorans]
MYASILNGSKTSYRTMKLKVKNKFQIFFQAIFGLFICTKRQSLVNVLVNRPESKPPKSAIYTALYLHEYKAVYFNQIKPLFLYQIVPAYHLKNPDTVEVVGSNPIVPTRKYKGLIRKNQALFFVAHDNIMGKGMDFLSLSQNTWTKSA